MSDIHLEAITDFTVFVSGRGHIHGDPNNKDARAPKVPEPFAGQLIAAGKARIYRETSKAKSAATAKQVKAAEQPPATEFTMTYVPIGKYEISGPGLDQPLEIKGKNAAKAKLAELNAAHSQKSQDGDAPTD